LLLKIKRAEGSVEKVRREKKGNEKTQVLTRRHDY